MEKKNYVCPKCGCKKYESDQFQATGGNFAKMFDVQNKKFITISCKECGKPYLRWVGYQWGEFCGYNCRCKYEREHPKKQIHTMKGWGG